MSVKSRDDQLALWLKGENQHNHIDGECCPDFACCQPHNHWSPELREKFAKAHYAKDEDTVMSMLGMALTAAFSNAAQIVHLAGEHQVAH